MQCDDFSNLKLCNSKHAYSEMRHSLMFLLCVLLTPADFSFTACSLSSYPMLFYFTDLMMMMMMMDVSSPS